MPDKKSSSFLSKKIVDEIRVCVHQKLTEYNKLNDVLGEYIFYILERNSRVLYYPLNDDDVWGFLENKNGHTFICINTSIPYEKQIFVAAHELYHLWYNHGEELILSSCLEETSDDSITQNELKANRFAAEFLVPEILLLQEMNTYSLTSGNLGIKEVLKLSHIFLIPYKTMVKRLFEIGKLGKKQFYSFMEISEDQITIWRRRLGLELSERENKISLDNLLDKAMDAFERKLITREKLEYLLSFTNTTPEQFGILPDKEYVPPTSEILQEILEEE
jgi:Zn-dependent peptidase ImmA (M78 family)